MVLSGKSKKIENHKILNPLTCVKTVSATVTVAFFVPLFIKVENCI